jgi:hypothetical protein
MRVVVAIVVAVVAVVALARSNPRFAVDENAVRDRIAARGLVGDELDDTVDEVRRICKIRDLHEFSAAVDARGELADPVDALNDVVTACPQRFD